MEQPRLTKEISQLVLQDPDLQVELAKICGIKVSGIYSAVQRRSSSLTTYMAVKKIAEKIGWPEESLVELSR